MLYTTFKFGWGPLENGWSLFAVGVMSALVQGVLLGRLLKRFSPQRLAVLGLVSSTLAYLGCGPRRREGWMMFAVIFANVLGFTVAASMQSIISSAADARTQGQTMGAVAALQQPDGGGRAGARRAAARRRLAPAARRLAHRRAVLLLRRCCSSPRSAWPGSHFRERRQRRAAPSPPHRLTHRTPMHDKILILDFGSQVTQLIARRVREAHVFCEIHPNDVSDAFIREFAPKGIILSGSHASTYEEHELRAPQAVWELGVPVLGICYGMFTMAVQHGGQVEASTHREFGYAEVRARGHTRLLDGIEDFATDRRPRHAEGLDEPRRQGHRAAARLQADGLDAELPDRRHGRRGARLLRACSSIPRSRTP